MKDTKVVLDKVHIDNLLSLHKVELLIKPLTILVGPNASGKSNVLKALKLLKEMILEGPPEVGEMQNLLWAGTANSVNFQLQAHLGKKLISYRLNLRVVRNKSQFHSEELIVDGIKVISVEKEKGEIRDEDNQNPIPYRSTKLALGSAGDYGHKPVTNALTNFIRNWEFYDFDPSTMRSFMSNPLVLNSIRNALSLQTISEVNRLNDEGSFLALLLTNWYLNDPERFEAIKEALNQSGGFGIGVRNIEGKIKLYLLEGYKNPIPLDQASDGTLRLLAYYVLLNQPELPSLIAIEEPERNLHPGLFMELGRLLRNLSQRTQLIITTHSSQLLDTFNAEDLTDTLEVLLLRNEPGKGTQVINLEEVQQDREAVKDWMEEFGLGSTIFESQLLQDMVEG